MDFKSSGSNYGAVKQCADSCNWMSVISVLLPLQEVYSKWQAIGHELGIRKERLYEIEQKHGYNDSTRCFSVMLEEWWDCDDDDASKKLALVQALSNPHVGLDCTTLKAKLQNKSICECSCAIIEPENEFKVASKGGATAVGTAQTVNNVWKTNLSAFSHDSEDLQLPNESRVKEFRTESDLAEKTRHLEDEFFKLIHKVFYSLKRTKVPMREIQCCLACFEDPDRFIEATNLDDFFPLLGSCVSWFNYSLLETIVENFATKDVQQAMRCYVSRLKSTLEERKVSELPPDIYRHAIRKCGNPSIVENNKQKLGIKIDYVWEKFLVRDIQILRERIASILGIDERSLFLLSVTEGCVYLEFLVPEFVTEEILSIEITPEIHSQFERAQVFEVECNSVLVYTNEIEQQAEQTLSMTHAYTNTECVFVKVS